MARELKFEWFFPQEAEIVWECLTTSDLITKWLMANDFKPVVGHKFQFKSKPVPGWSGIVYCKVLEARPFTRLSYSWESGPKPEKINMSTVVTWILEEENGGTRLRLSHAGFEGFKGYMISRMMGKGWRTHIADALKKTIEARAAKRATA